MMKFVVKTTKPHNVKTVVSMNPIMVDGTGKCGGCRLTVGGQTKFACVDGPDFDGLRSILTRLCTAARCTSPLRHTPRGRVQLLKQGCSNYCRIWTRKSAHAQPGAERPQQKLQGSRPRLHRGDGRERGQALPAVQEPPLPQRPAPLNIDIPASSSTSPRATLRPLTT